MVVLLLWGIFGVLRAGASAEMASVSDMEERREKLLDELVAIERDGNTEDKKRKRAIEKELTSLLQTIPLPD